jgi:cyclophilin family peptidyl-prolyl cis-trans isomerase
MRWRAHTIAIGAAALLLVAGCGDGDEGGEEAASLPAGCETVEAPEPKAAEAERRKQPLTGTATATVETNCGSFTIELDTASSPKTTASFAGLAEQGFYAGTSFSRIEPGFVVQGGDPTGDRTGGPDYSVDEPPPQDLTYARGTVAMAKTEVEPPGRSGSQFFIVTAPADAGLSPDYALLGTVGEGYDTIERIEQLGGPDGTPLAPVVISEITVKSG